MSMQLFIGNKNYSSWSMRPWVLLRQAEIPFEEVMLRFDSFTPDSRFKTELALHSPAGRVPVLVDEGFAVWDTRRSPSTSPRSIPIGSCGPPIGRRAPAPAVSVPRCTPVSAPCAATSR